VTLLPSTELTLETPADVSVHLVRIGNLGETMTERMAVRDILSADERERSERFVRPGLRGRFIYTRATLRHLLAERLNTTPKTLTFEQSKDGRPFLSQTEDPSPLDFNVTHSGDMALIAIGSSQHRIGIDIEQVREMRDLEQMANRVLTPFERAALNQLDFHSNLEQTKRALFFRYWTCKEAYLKALGTGLQIDMQRIEAQLSHPNGVNFLKLPDRPPTLAYNFTPAPHHQAALVLLSARSE